MVRKLIMTLIALVAIPATHATTIEYVDVEAIINTLYKEKSGFRIPDKEKECIKTAGGDHTYGEITYPSCAFLLDTLHLTADDKFVDMGCGIGKFVVQAALTTEVGSAVGIELSETRCSCAQDMLKPVKGLYETCVKAENEIRKKLQQPQLKRVKKDIRFIHSDMLKVDISDATVVFMCATCFSEELMQKIADKLSLCNDGLRVITLKQFPARNKQFVLTDTYTLAMTWSKTTPVYVYKLDRSGNALEDVSDVDMMEVDDMKAAG